MKIKFFGLLWVVLICSEAWGNDGDVFTGKTVEGVEMYFTVLSEAEKTCKVGSDDVHHSYLDENESSIDRNQEGTLTIPESINGYMVKAIGAFSFYGCKIEEFHLPNTIEIIDKYAFAENDYLKSIDIPESVVSIEERAYFYCKELLQVNFHDGLKTIGGDAFYACKLTSLVLPKTLEFIDYCAFDINPLATITLRSSTPFLIKSSTFDDKICQRTTLFVPQGTKGNFKGVWNSFRKIKEGEPLFERPTDIVIPVDADGKKYWPYIVCNNETSINVNFENQRITPVSSISFIPVIDGVEGEEKTYEFPESIDADVKTFTMPASLPNIKDPKTYTFLIEITKINGVEVDYGADIRPNASIRGTAFIPVMSHKVWFKNCTSPSCLWAMRSYIGLEKVKERFGDNVICTNYHLTGPLWCQPFSYIPLIPSCELDNDAAWGENDNFNYYDPYYGKSSNPLGIFDLVEEKMSSPHLGNIKILSAQWADIDQTEINIVTESTFGLSYQQPKTYESRDYLILYTLVEDGLKGDGSEWEQLNGYAQMTTDDPNLQPLTQLPYTITDIEYNDVAVGDYRNYIHQDFNCGEKIYQSYTLQLSEVSRNIIQNKSRLSVVVRLQDHTEYGAWAEGRIQIDCDKLPIEAYSSDVQNIKQGAIPHDVFDLSGRKVKTAATTLNDLPKGIYIFGGKKIVIGNQ